MDCDVRKRLRFDIGSKDDQGQNRVTEVGANLGEYVVSVRGD